VSAASSDDRVLQWVGGLPERWETTALGTRLKENKSSNKGLVEKQVLSLSYGRVVIKPEEKLRGLVPESFETYQILEPGDIVIRPTDLQNDQTSLRIGQSHFRGIITSAYIAVRPQNGMDHRFAAYMLAAYDFMKVFYGFGSGLRQNLDFKHIKHIPIPVPPLEEQTLIVRYLDHAELRIAKAIAGKSEVLAKLREAKTAVIGDSVLGEVRPGDQGTTIELGVIPSAWSVISLRGLLRPRAERNRPDLPLLSVVRSAGVIVRSLDKADNHNFIPEDLSNYKVVHTGDLVINKMKAWSGSAGIARMDGIVSPAYFVFSLAGETDPEYMNLLFRSPQMRDQFARASRGVRVGQWDLSLQDVKSVLIPVPPLEEQCEIARRIGERTSAIDAAMDAVNAEMALLKEYRTRLISDVVTGKLDVRDEAATLPEIDPMEFSTVAVGENGDDEEATDDD